MPEDELRIMRNESKGMTDKMPEMMATMTRCQGQGEQKEPGGVEESATVKERLERASPASRAGNSREFEIRRNLGKQVGDQVRAVLEEVGPER